jgi:hypothetical protein
MFSKHDPEFLIAFLSFIIHKVANAEMPSWVRELVEKYIDTLTLRKAEQSAKYIATSVRRGEVRT